MKIRFYIISLIILFCFSIIIDFNPVDQNGTLMSFCDLLLHNWFSVICFVFVILGVLYMVWQNHIFTGATNPCYKIEKIDNESYEFLTFISTYIIPLICFNFDNTRYKILFFIILIIIGVMFVRMDLYLANPILAILGYKLYRIKTNGHENVLVITRDKLTVNDSIDWIELDNKCWLVRRRKNERSGVENEG